MATQERLNENRKILDKFLVIKPIPIEYQLPVNMTPFGYIYCIENINNHMKYIGSTYSTWVGIQRPTVYSQLYKRASHYIYEYNHYRDAINNGVSVKRRFLRPLIRAMVEEGINNFIMYPIAETTSLTHLKLEQELINKFDTINNGYNTDFAQNTIKYKNTNSPIGKPMSEADKKLRSTSVVCINLESKQIVFSDSMKLFADYLGTSKDMIKNSNRIGRPYKNWYIFYTDAEKRAYVLNNNVLQGNINNHNCRHSNESKEFYKGLSMTIDDFLKSDTPYEFFPGFIYLPDIVYNTENK